MNPQYRSHGSFPTTHGRPWGVWIGCVLSAATLVRLAALAEPPQPASVDVPRLRIEPVATPDDPATGAPEFKFSPAASPFGTFTHDSGPAMAKVNQDASQARLEASARKLTPEEAGGPYPYLKRQPGWRSVAELFNPFAPLPKIDETAALAFETRIPLRASVPRVPSDAAWLEGGLSLLSFAATR